MFDNMTPEEIIEKFGMPIYLSPFVPEGQMIIAQDPGILGGGQCAMVRYGSVIGDKIQYGWEDGHLIGPIKRYERARDRLYSSAMSMVADAYEKAKSGLDRLEERLNDRHQ